MITLLSDRCADLVETHPRRLGMMWLKYNHLVSTSCSHCACGPGNGVLRPYPRPHAFTHARLRNPDTTRPGTFAKSAQGVCTFRHHFYTRGCPFHLSQCLFDTAGCSLSQSMLSHPWQLFLIMFGQCGGLWAAVLNGKREGEGLQHPA